MTIRTDTLRLVQPREAVERWSVFEPMVRRVLDHVDSGLYPDDVLTCIQIGTMHLWDVLRGQAACVTELQTFSKHRQLLVFLVAGSNAGDWIASGDQQLTAFAKSQGCKYIYFQGRPGWEKYTARLGYTDKHIVMRKAV